MEKQNQQINYNDFRKKYVQLVVGEGKIKIIGELVKYCQNKVYLVEPNGNKRTFLDSYIDPNSIKIVQRPKDAIKVNYAEFKEKKAKNTDENIDEKVDKEVTEIDKFLNDKNTDADNKRTLEERI